VAAARHAVPISAVDEMKKRFMMGLILLPLPQVIYYFAAGPHPRGLCRARCARSRGFACCNYPLRVAFRTSMSTVRPIVRAFRPAVSAVQLLFRYVDGRRAYALERTKRHRAGGGAHVSAAGADRGGASARAERTGTVSRSRGRAQIDAGVHRRGRRADGEREAGDLRLVRGQEGGVELVLQSGAPGGDAAVLPGVGRRE